MRKFLAMLMVSGMTLGLLGCSEPPAAKPPATPPADKKADGDKKEAPPADKKEAAPAAK